MQVIKSVLSEDLIHNSITLLDELLKTNRWVSSNFIWPKGALRGVSGSCISTRVPAVLHDLIEDEIKQHLPEYERLTTCFYVWERLSGLGMHEDEGYKFNATIYLNEDWEPDFGGALIWEEKETGDTGIYNCIFPERGWMALNVGEQRHLVTNISPQAPEPRRTIQIRGY